MVGPSVVVLAFYVGLAVAASTNSEDYLCRQLRSLSNSEDGVFSQYSEDGVLISLLDILGIDEKRKFFVEFGVESGLQCNTRILRERLGFSGLVNPSHGDY